MSSYRLDRKITIQTRNTARTATGAQADTWTNLATVYAQKKDIPSIRRGSMFIADQHNDSLYTEWTVRYMDGLTGAERIVDAYGTVYKVAGVPVEVGRREWLIIVSEQGVMKS